MQSVTRPDMSRHSQPISLLNFLITGNFGSFVPAQTRTPEDVFAIFGSADELYLPYNSDIPYTPGNPECFPLIVSYGVVEFIFNEPMKLAAIFVDKFIDGLPDAGSLLLTETSLLREYTPIESFLQLAATNGITVRNVRPYPPPDDILLTTCGGIEIGFENHDPDAPGSVPTLRWFSWVARPTPPWGSGNSGKQDSKI
jgi:hypothetical protein